MKNFKRVLSVVLVVLMITVLFVSCTKKEEPASSTVEPSKSAEPSKSEEPSSSVVEEPKGQVIIGTDTEANGDWAYGAFAASINATDNDVIKLTDDCVTVTSNQAGESVINDSVVESYERTEDADNNVTFTFKIRQGLVFNNGDPIKAENFLAWPLFTLSKAGADMGTTAIADATPGGPDYRAGKVNYLAGYRLLGEYEFSITTLAVGYSGTEYLPYYYDITNGTARAVNLDYWFGKGWSVKDDGQGAYLVNADGKELTKENVGDQVAAAQYATSDRVTAGPYNLVSFDKSANEITLEVNPNYCGNFEGQKPQIKKLVIVKTEEATIMDNLATGGVELYSGIADGSKVNAALDLIDSGKFDGNYCQYDRAGYGQLIFACDLGPTQYVEFRQAIAYLLNRNDFAKTFCEGWGGVVHGPYCPAFTMYKDSRDLFAEKLNTYEFNPEKAVELLKQAGFTLNADGSEYVDGSGEVRYKEVTAEEALHYEDFCKKAGDKLLMPAMVNWSSSEGNTVSDLLATMLANGADTKNAGIEIKQNVMSFPELLNYYYRQDVYGLGGDYSVPTYNMFNMGTGFNSGNYDQSYEYTTDPDWQAEGYNTAHINDKELDEYSMKMVYGVEPGDYATYLDLWQKFIIRFNEMLPQLPLYANVYVTVYPNTIENYQEGPFWGYSNAILYAKYVG